MEELHAIVSGRVQMVMMRDFVCRKAQSLGLFGFVQNLPDGTVEVLAQGFRDKLEILAGHLQTGSVLARVDKVEMVWGAPSSLFESFTLRR